MLIIQKPDWRLSTDLLWGGKDKEKEEEGKKAQPLVGFESMIFYAIAPKACALPLRYNPCQCCAWYLNLAVQADPWGKPGPIRHVRRSLWAKPQRSVSSIPGSRDERSFWKIDHLQRRDGQQPRARQPRHPLRQERTQCFGLGWVTCCLVNLASIVSKVPWHPNMTLQV